MFPVWTHQQEVEISRENVEVSGVRDSARAGRKRGQEYQEGARSI